MHTICINAGTWFRARGYYIDTIAQFTNVIIICFRLFVSTDICTIRTATVLRVPINKCGYRVQYNYNLIMLLYIIFNCCSIVLYIVYVRGERKYYNKPIFRNSFLFRRGYTEENKTLKYHECPTRSCRRPTLLTATLRELF